MYLTWIGFDYEESLSVLFNNISLFLKHLVVVNNKIMLQIMLIVDIHWNLAGRHSLMFNFDEDG